MEYGFGERKTPESFPIACSRFIKLENIVETESTKKKDAAASGPAETEKKERPRKAIAVIAKAVEDSGGDGGVDPANVGSRILGATPDFDPRTYGCPNSSTLITKSVGIEVRKEPGKPVLICRKSAARDQAPA